MQQNNKKVTHFKKSVGEVLNEMRSDSHKTSRSTFAREYDIDRGNLSKLERGVIGCTLMTAWKISEACGIKFSDFAKMLENKLGKDFKLMDE